MPRKRSDPCLEHRSGLPAPSLLLAGYPATYMAISALLVLALGVAIYFTPRLELLLSVFFSTNEVWKLVLESPSPLPACFLWWMKLGYYQLWKRATAAWQWLRRA